MRVSYGNILIVLAVGMYVCLPQAMWRSSRGRRQVEQVAVGTLHPRRERIVRRPASLSSHESRISSVTEHEAAFNGGWCFSMEALSEAASHPRSTSYPRGARMRADDDLNVDINMRGRHCVYRDR